MSFGPCPSTGRRANGRYAPLVHDESDVDKATQMCYNVSVTRTQTNNQMIADAKWKLTLNGHHRNPLRDALRKCDNRELHAEYRKSLENNLKHPVHKAYSDFLWMMCVQRGIITTKTISL